MCEGEGEERPSAGCAAPLRRAWCISDLPVACSLRRRSKRACWHLARSRVRVNFVYTTVHEGLERARRGRPRQKLGAKTHRNRIPTPVHVRSDGFLGTRVVVVVRVQQVGSVSRCFFLATSCSDCELRLLAAHPTSACSCSQASNKWGKRGKYISSHSSFFFVFLRDPFSRFA